MFFELTQTFQSFVAPILSVVKLAAGIEMGINIYLQKPS